MTGSNTTGDSTVVVPTGQNMDTSSVLAVDGVTNLQRQRMVVGDPVNTSFLVKVNADGYMQIDSQEIVELLNEIVKSIDDMKWAIISKLG